MTRFAVELKFANNKDELLALRVAHREYLKRLTERGVLLAAGPWADGMGALQIYEVADVDELRQVLDADPYAVTKAVTDTVIHEWQPVLGSWLIS